MLSTFCANIDENVQYLNCTTTARGIRDDFTLSMKDQMDREGFLRKACVTDDGINFEMYVRDPIIVLRKQIAATPSEGFMARPSTSDVVSNSPNAHIINAESPLASSHNKKCADADVPWRYVRSDVEPYVIGGSEKSEIGGYFKF